MPPRTRLQTKPNKKGKRPVVEDEPPRTDRMTKPLSPDTESFASIAHPGIDQMGPTGSRLDEAGPSRPPLREGGPVRFGAEGEGQPRPNTASGVDMDVLVQVMTDVAR